MITQERLKEVLKYARDTGVFTRLVATSNNVSTGGTVGCLDNGYLKARVDGTCYGLHRLAWLYVHGYLPEGEVDHINRDRSDNRLINLREVTTACNQRNTGNPSDNTSGVKGVSKHRRTGKWVPKIVVSGKAINLGYHKNFDEAVCHRLAAEQAEGWAGCDSASPAFKYVQRMLAV